MIPEYGQLALNFAFFLSICLAILPLLGTIYGRVVWMATARSLLMLVGWTFAVSIFSKKMPLEVVARVLSVMGMVAVGFLAFTIITSNPFERILPNTPTDGSDLNPLLQDPGVGAAGGSGILWRTHPLCLGLLVPLWCIPLL